VDALRSPSQYCEINKNGISFPLLHRHILLNVLFDTVNLWGIARTDAHGTAQLQGFSLVQREYTLC
jgi:hypothetical protein